MRSRYSGWFPNKLYVFSVGSRESGFQTVVAQGSRPCVGFTIRTGGTPVPLPWKRRGRRNFVCLRPLSTHNKFMHTRNPLRLGEVLRRAAGLVACQSCLNHRLTHDTSAAVPV